MAGKSQAGFDAYVKEHALTPFFLHPVMGDKILCIVCGDCGGHRLTGILAELNYTCNQRTFELVGCMAGAGMPVSLDDPTTQSFILREFERWHQVKPGVMTVVLATHSDCGMENLRDHDIKQHIADLRRGRDFLAGNILDCDGNPIRVITAIKGDGDGNNRLFVIPD